MILGGCAAPGPTAMTYSVRRVSQGDVEGLLNAASIALEAEGFVIEKSDPEQGLVTTRPARVEPAAADAGWSGRPAQRSVAQVQVTRGEGGMSIFCKVEIQRQTTEAYRLFQQARTRTDLPDETAIDRDAATTAEQNTVWETVRRDKAAERRVLQAIVGK